MRYWVGFVLVAAVAASPLVVSAQVGEEAESQELNVEEPALSLEVDDAGIDVAPRPPRTRDGYTLEEMDLRVRRARIGLLSMMGVTLLGGMLIGIGASQLDFDTADGGVALWTGFSLASGGFIGMATTGGMLAHRKRKRAGLRDADKADTED